MASVNKCIIVGNLGKDPELRTLPNGNDVCNFSVATSETWKDKTTGEKKTETEWHNISMFGSLASIAGKYLKKGSHVYLEGKLKTRSWETNEGEKKYSTGIVADKMVMLGSKEGLAPNRIDEGAQGKIDSSEYPEDSFDGKHDDLPF